MRDFIAHKLDNMSDLEQKETLRAVLEQVFLPLYDETVEKYMDLENRVKNELATPSNGYAVYCTLLPKNKAVSHVPWLFPIVEPAVDGEMLKKNAVIDTVFLEADYLTCREILFCPELYEGTIHIEGRDIPVQVSLMPSKKYLNAISELYPHFINNGVGWETLNVPYIYKMFDICLASDIDISDEEVASHPIEWNISFHNYDIYLKKDLVPVWNINRIASKSDGFPLPVVEKKTYEYRIDLSEEGVENEYLADYNMTPIVSTRREKDSYIIAVQSKRNGDWSLYKVIKPAMTETVNFSYPVISNYQEDHFAARMVKQYASKINTKAELARVINSFDIHRFIKYEDCRVLNNKSLTGETYECNFFIKDEIRDENISKTLMLQFSKNNTKNTYLMRDIMSFVVSQVQLIYPEYNCVGALL